MKKSTRLTIEITSALVMSSFLIWLAVDFRPGVVLGRVQDFLRWLYVLPYVLGIALGKDPHNPNMIVFAIGIFIEVLCIVWAIRYIFIKRGKEDRDA